MWESDSQGRIQIVSFRPSAPRKEVSKEELDLRFLVNPHSSGKTDACSQPVALERKSHNIMRKMCEKALSERAESARHLCLYGIGREDS